MRSEEREALQKAFDGINETISQLISAVNAISTRQKEVDQELIAIKQHVKLETPTIKELKLPKTIGDKDWKGLIN